MAADGWKPKILFFGPPRSGKSQLLQSLLLTLQQTPGTEIIPLPPHESPQLIPHRFWVRQPATTSAAGALPPGKLEFIECDGQAAQELLHQPDARLRARTADALAEAVRSADALVVVFDATDQQFEFEEGFQQVVQFLEILYEERERARIVGGLPVFLTLTKCDQLARPRDKQSDWLKKVDRKVEWLHLAFSELINRQTEELAGGYCGFGSLDIITMATSTEAPRTDQLEHAFDPQTRSYRIQEFTESVVREAWLHELRERTARKRLRRTVAGTASLSGLFLVALLWLTVWGGGTRADGLADRVQQFQANEGPPAERLAERRLTAYRRTLEGFMAHPQFAQLPPELQGYLQDRSAELEAYLVWRNGFQPPVLGPAEIRTNEQARELTRELNVQRAPPPAYSPAWDMTEIGVLRAKWLKDLELWPVAQETLAEHYRGAIRRANELILTREPLTATWRQAGQTVIQQGNTLPKPTTETVPGSPSAPGWRGKPLTYAALYDSERVLQARRDWSTTRDRLQSLLDLSAVTGLTTAAGDPEAVLNLPEPQVAPQLELAQLVLTRLGERVPNRAPQSALAVGLFPGWFEGNFPEPIRQQILGRLQTIRATAERHIRLLIQAESTLVPDVAAAVDQWAARPGAAAWDQLLQLLLHLQQPASLTPPASPVQELQEFVHRTEFEAPTAWLVILSDDLLPQRAQPAKRLVLSWESLGEPRQERELNLVGEGERARPETRYRFESPGPTIRLPRRGRCSVSLGIRAGDTDYRLVWSSVAEQLYPFEVFHQPPQLERLGPGGTLAPSRGARLEAAPPGRLPRMPQLSPRELFR